MVVLIHILDFWVFSCYLEPTRKLRLMVSPQYAEKENSSPLGPSDSTPDRGIAFSASSFPRMFTLKHKSWVHSLDWWIPATCSSLWARAPERQVSGSLTILQIIKMSGLCWTALPDKCVPPSGFIHYMLKHLASQTPCIRLFPCISPPTVCFNIFCLDYFNGFLNALTPVSHLAMRSSHGHYIFISTWVTACLSSCENHPWLLVAKI